MCVVIENESKAKYKEVSFDMRNHTVFHKLKSYCKKKAIIRIYIVWLHSQKL